MIVLKPKLRRSKLVERKLTNRIKRLNTKKNTIFVTPIRPIVSEIKKSLLRDKQGFNHVFTKNIYNNTRFEVSQHQDEDLDFSFKLSFGYFVPYGINLERGGEPRKVPIGVLIGWINRTFKRPDDAYKRALGLQKAIEKRGTKGTPIIQNTWKSKKSEYMAEVAKRIRKQWR